MPDLHTPSQGKTLAGICLFSQARPVAASTPTACAAAPLPSSSTVVASSTIASMTPRPGSARSTASLSLSPQGSDDDPPPLERIDAPGSTVELRLEVEDNTLKNAIAAAEQRRVTVVAEYGAGDAVRAEYIYEVVNLAGVG